MICKQCFLYPFAPVSLVNAVTPETYTPLVSQKMKSLFPLACLNKQT